MGRSLFRNMVSRAFGLTGPKAVFSAGRVMQRAALGLVHATSRKRRQVSKPSTPKVSKALPAQRNGSFRWKKVVLSQRMLSYKLFLPASQKGTFQPMPLLIMLHGCSQTPDDFAQGTAMNRLALEHGWMIAYPRQTRAANRKKCWNWFSPADQSRGAGEPALIAGMTLQILQEHAGDPRRVYIAGLSAGGAAAAAVASAYPEIFAAVGVHSGLPIGAARGTLSALVAMNAGSSGSRQSTPMPTIVFHGDADDVVHPRNGRAIAARSVATFPDLLETERHGRAIGGRSYVRTTHRAGNRKSYCEHWQIKGAGHAWSGGDAAGSFTDGAGPDASSEMIRFFRQHRNTAAPRPDPEP